MAGHINVFSLYEYEKIRELAHGVKEGNRNAIEKAAKVIIRTAEFFFPISESIIVPMAGHNGRAQYTKELAEIVAKRFGVKCVDALECRAHKPLYDEKYEYPNREITLPDMQITDVMRKQYGGYLTDYGKHIIVIDNVVDTGSTAMAAFNAFGGKSYDLVVLGHTQNYTKYGYPFELRRPIMLESIYGIDWLATL